MYEADGIRVKPTLAVLAGLDGLHRLANGLTVAQQLLSLAEGPAFISTNCPEWFERFDVPLVADVVSNRGSAGGVVTALAFATTEWVQVVSCQLPFVTKAVLKQLWAHRHANTDAICLSVGGKIEPLVGLYRRELVYDWEPRLDGAPALISLVESCRVDEVRWSGEELRRLNSSRGLRSADESFSNAWSVGTVPSQVAPW